MVTNNNRVPEERIDYFYSRLKQVSAFQGSMDITWLCFRDPNQGEHKPKIQNKWLLKIGALIHNLEPQSTATAI